MTAKSLVILAALIVLAACTETETYPLSGESCSEKDPVHTLDASDCLMPTPVS